MFTGLYNKKMSTNQDLVQCAEIFKKSKLTPQQLITTEALSSLIMKLPT